MACFYALELRHYVYGTYCECYDIGIFRTRADAERTAQRYLQEVPGFCDYECDYLIHEIELDCSDALTHIFTYEGWNTDDNGGTTDIIEGKFPDRAQAEAAMEAAKVSHPRQSWSLDCWEIGKCEWAEGFEWVCPDGWILPGLPDSIGMLQHFIEYRTACTVSFLYDERSILIRPVAVGSKLFLFRCDEQDDSHRFSIRQLRDIYRMESLPQAIPEDDSEAGEGLLEKLSSLADFDSFEDLDLDSMELFPGTRESTDLDPLEIRSSLADFNPLEDLDLTNVELLPGAEESMEMNDEEIDDPVPEVDLTGWRSAFESLKERSACVTVRQDYEEPSSCTGYIAAVEPDRVVMDLTQEGAENEQVTVEFARITAIEFDDM